MKKLKKKKKIEVGRPRELKQPVRYLVVLEKAHIELLFKLSRRLKLRGRSEALRLILDTFGEAL